MHGRVVVSESRHILQKDASAAPVVRIASKMSLCTRRWRRPPCAMQSGGKLAVCAGGGRGLHGDGGLRGDDGLHGEGVRVQWSGAGKGEQWVAQTTDLALSLLLVLRFRVSSSRCRLCRRRSRRRVCRRGERRPGGDPPGRRWPHWGRWQRLAGTCQL